MNDEDLQASRRIEIVGSGLRAYAGLLASDLICFNLNLVCVPFHCALHVFSRCATFGDEESGASVKILCENAGLIMSHFSDSILR
jgi:hypothetical protein